MLPVDAPKERRQFQFIHSPLRSQPAVALATKPGDRVPSLFGDGHFRREDERFPPSHDFPVRVLGVLAAERGVADQHLVHNDPQAPPIACGAIARLEEHFRRDVIRRAHRGIRERSPVLLPALCAAFAVHGTRRGHDEIGGLRLAQIPVELRSMRFFQPRAQPEVRELQMSPCVQKEIVWFDIAVNEAQFVY